MTAESTPIVDGRRQRSVRSRQAIIDASIALIEEGYLVPTAQRVSDRAGVGIRSFFRHFEDMESLFTEIDRIVVARHEGQFASIDYSGDLEIRVTNLVEFWSLIYSDDKAMLMTTKVQMWRYQVLRTNYSRVQSAISNTIAKWLPELVDSEPGKTIIVEALVSFEMWHRLTDLQNVSSEEAKQQLKRILLLELNN